MSNKRKYDSSKRRAKADAAKIRVVETARELLLRDGFQETTISEIATSAQVSQQSIYSVFGSKAAIVIAMLTRLEDEAGEAETMQRLQQAESPSEQLLIFTSWIAGFFEKSADVFSIMMQSPSEPELAETRRIGDERRMGGCFMLASRWAEEGALKISVNEAADRLWLLTSFETYHQATTVRGWSADQYQNWVYETSSQQLFK